MSASYPLSNIIVWLYNVLIVFQICIILFWRLLSVMSLTFQETQELEYDFSWEELQNL